MTGVAAIATSFGTRISQLQHLLTTQQQQKQSTPLPHLGMLNPKRQRLQDLHRQVEIQQIVVNSMLVVYGTEVGTSILTAGKQAIQSSLTPWDTEILTTAVPALL